jgi:hypothetical protein
VRSLPSPVGQIVIGGLLVALALWGRPLLRVFFEGARDLGTGGRTVRDRVKGSTNDDGAHTDAVVVIVRLVVGLGGALTAGEGVLRLLT